jgi:hypothetical protein
LPDKFITEAFDQNSVEAVNDIIKCMVSQTKQYKSRELLTADQFSELLECSERYVLGTNIESRGFLVITVFAGVGARKAADDELAKKDTEKFDRLCSRLRIVAFSGAALIAPMLIMTLHRTKLKSLLTTSIFVSVVGIALAYTMDDAEQKNIAGVTAVYTAVLVIFVGASLAPV